MTALWHPTPVVQDAAGPRPCKRMNRYGKPQFGPPLADFANTNWQAALMTEEQRLAYNVRQLGVTGAAEYERPETERRAKKKACK